LLTFDLTADNAHKEFEKLIKSSVLIKFTPEPKNEIGTNLFKNGLFLIALVKLITRSSPNPFILNYIYEYLENAFGFSLERNSFVFKSECAKAKSVYESMLEKKYNDMLLSRVEQRHESKK
jgi:hypothetical protein